MNVHGGTDHWLSTILSPQPLPLDPETPESSTAQVHDGAAQVRVERIWPTELAEPTGHSDERLVGDVLSSAVVTGQQPGEPNRPRDVPYV